MMSEEQGKLLEQTLLINEKKSVKDYAKEFKDSGHKVTKLKDTMTRLGKYNDLSDDQLYASKNRVLKISINILKGIILLNAWKLLTRLNVMGLILTRLALMAITRGELALIRKEVRECIENLRKIEKLSNNPEDKIKIQRIIRNLERKMK
jgi:hypothetical protein